ncbi:MAG: polysaccharide deacetylase family protein [Desulfovibrio sp.]|nr:polysaccharide deacetylase family protein [Desulfovibrio sp.]
MKKILILLFVLFCARNLCAAVVGGNRIMDQRMPENLCALTFDDGPSANTAELLDMLDSYGIKATFFLLGQNARHFPEIVRRIDAEGHETGNHTWSHPNLRVCSYERQYSELAETDALLRSLGVTPLYMRPPYGNFDDRTIEIANELGVDIILWSLDSRDWKKLPEDYAKLPSTRGTIYDDGALRGIFLFHDTHKTTVQDLPKIIANLKAGGCERFVTVSEYLAGIIDPEPALAMSRHEPQRPPAPVRARPAAPAYAAGSAPLPLARCSRPWKLTGGIAPGLDLEEAQAVAPATTGGL